MHMFGGAQAILSHWLMHSPLISEDQNWFQRTRELSLGFVELDQSRHLHKNYIMHETPSVCLNFSCYDRQHQQPVSRIQPSVYYCRYYPPSPPTCSLHHFRSLHLDRVEQHRKGTGLLTASAGTSTSVMQHWRRRLPRTAPEQVPVSTSIGYMLVQCRALRNNGGGSSTYCEDRTAGAALSV